MIQRMMPEIHAIYVRILRQSVLGQESRESPIQAATPPTLTTPTQEEIQRYQVKAPAKILKASSRAVRLFARDEELHSHNERKDLADEYQTHMAHLREKLTLFADMLLSDIGAAEDLLQDSTTLAGKAATTLHQLLRLQDHQTVMLIYSPMQRVLSDIEIMLEEALSKAIAELPPDPEIRDRYSKTAESLINLYNERLKQPGANQRG